MAQIENTRSSRTWGMTAFKADAGFWGRFFAGTLGAILCIVGAAVAVFPFYELSMEFRLMKFALGVLVFVAGFVIARSGYRSPGSELHYDPKYGEFILVPCEEELNAAQCVMSTDTTHVVVSGRHLSVASDNERLKIKIAMADAQSAQRVSQSCQSRPEAA